MRNKTRKFLSILLCFSMAIGMAGCTKKIKKEPKPKPKVTVAAEKGNAKATGKGDGQADSPIIIGCDRLNKNFNPFTAKSNGDKEVVRLTQAYLVTSDRKGKTVYKGIGGEVRKYKDNGYTYYGPADISVQYNKKKNKTFYKINLDKGMFFSDGEKVTVDDVIFSMYVFCDSSYKGDEQLGRQNILGLKKYRKKKKVKKIAGIRKTGKYSLTLITSGYSDDTIKSLHIPICPLHYYGNEQRYNYKKGNFGFKKGDISTVCANKKSPMGAGPYRYVKYEKKIVYYTYNELYFNGCPKTAFVQIKEMHGILKKAEKRIAQAVKQENAAAQQDTADEQNGGEKSDDTGKNNDDALNHVAEVTEITHGVVDVMSKDITGDNLEWIAKANSNEELSGNQINTRFVAENKFSYIGINAKNVSVGGDGGSNESIALRKAIASVISAQRINMKEELSDKVKIINYPFTSDSWLSPAVEDKNYNRAYSDSADGGEIYNDDMSDEERNMATVEAAQKYLEKAGYKFDENGVIGSVPEKASKTYRIMIENGRKNMLYPMLKKSSELLEKLGIELKIVSVSKKQMMSKKTIKNAQLWCAKTDTSYGFRLSRKYTSQKSMFGMKMPMFSAYLKKTDETVRAERKKKTYRKAFNTILEQAIEVPICQKQRIIMFSASRIKMDTMTKDTTTYYDWINEIQNVEMKE